MIGLTVIPGRPGTAELGEVRGDPVPDGWLEVDALACGICGTDREIVAGDHGRAPPEELRLVLGHESLGRVRRAPKGSGFSAGDLVVGIVRRPVASPCTSCAAGEPDMCRDGRFTEHGIHGAHGFCRERYALDPAGAVKLTPDLESIGMLVEPTSIVVKAWEHVSRIGARAQWHPRKALVTGAGPVGLLAAWIGRHRDLDVHVLDRVTSGRKPELVQKLGATYHCSGLEAAARDADVLIECTGAPSLVAAALTATRRVGIVCLTGLSTGGRSLDLDVGRVNRRIVLENDVVFGSVSSNRRHYAAAADLLARGDRGWLEALVTRRVPPARWREALDPDPAGVKSVIEFIGAS